jgi:hypothetical protein
VGARVAKYVAAAGVCATAAGAAFGIGPPVRCGLYGCTAGGGHSGTTFLLAILVGALIGLAAMAMVDGAINVRYAMVNHAEAKRRRRRAQTNNQSGT